MMLSRSICDPSPLHDTVARTETSVSLSSCADTETVQDSGVTMLSCTAWFSSAAQETVGDPAIRLRQRPVIRNDGTAVFFLFIGCSFLPPLYGGSFFNLYAIFI